MYRGGFKRPEFTSLEEWWGLHRETYYTAFRCLGPNFRARADVSPFVHAHVLAQLDQVRRLDLTERTQRQIWQALEEICSERGMSDRLANALWDAFNGREVTARYYREVNDVSRQTATNDLAAATAAKLLRPVGERRSRRYLAGNELMVAISELTKVPTASGEATRPQIVGRLAQRLIDDARPRPQQSATAATAEPRGEAPSPAHFWDGFGWVESRPETTVMLGKHLASLKQRPKGALRSRR
jgi:hypothetical protein